MKVYLDTEFTGLHKNADILSIGLVAESSPINGSNKFYAEFTDYDKSAEQDTWLAKNVFSNMVSYNKKLFEKCGYMPNLHIGTKQEIAIVLENWLQQFDTVELVADCAHYDMVQFCDIFGGAHYLPKKISPACYDLNQDIAKFYQVDSKTAFNLKRIEILEDLYDRCNTSSIERDFMSTFTIHNSLYDSILIQKIDYYMHKYLDMTNKPTTK